jgi:hypothetical protein
VFTNLFSLVAKTTCNISPFGPVIYFESNVFTFTVVTGICHHLDLFCSENNSIRRFEHLRLEPLELSSFCQFRTNNLCIFIRIRRQPRANLPFSRPRLYRINIPIVSCLALGLSKLISCLKFILSSLLLLRAPYFLVGNFLKLCDKICALEGSWRGRQKKRPRKEKSW